MTSNTFFQLMKAGFNPAQIQALEAIQGQSSPQIPQGQSTGQWTPQLNYGQPMPQGQTMPQDQQIDYQKLFAQFYQAGQATQLPTTTQTPEQINANMYASMIGLEIPGNNNFNLPSGVNPVGPNASY